MEKHRGGILPCTGPPSCPRAPACCCHTPTLHSPPLPHLQEYISTCQSLREGLEKSLRDKGIDASPPAPVNLPWFDLLAHPAA